LEAQENVFLKEVRKLENKVRNALGIEAEFETEWGEVTEEEYQTFKGETTNLKALAEAVRKRKLPLVFYPFVLPMAVTDRKKMYETFLLDKEKFASLIERYPEENVSLLEAMVLFKEVSLYLFQKCYGKAGYVLYKFAEKARWGLSVERKERKERNELPTKEPETESRKVERPANFDAVWASVKETLLELRLEAKNNFGVSLDFKRVMFVVPQVEKMFKSKAFQLQRERNPKKLESFLNKYEKKLSAHLKELDSLESYDGKEREAQNLRFVLNLLLNRIAGEKSALRGLESGNS